MSSVTDTRLYAAAIALVSGAYSGWSAMDDRSSMMVTSDAVMLIVGLAVIAHGIVLLTPLATGIGRVSGPLMIAWAVIMLVNQAVATSSASMMASWDAGMVALAVLMLASGVIMSRPRTSTETR